MSIDLSKYDRILNELQKYQTAHERWLEETWHQMNDFNTKVYLEGVIKNDATLMTLVESGSDEELSAFYERLKDTIPYLGIQFMKSLLDVCYTMERLQHTFSHDVVKWFRKMGWKFPEFNFEKIESIQQESIPNQ